MYGNIFFFFLKEKIKKEKEKLVLKQFVIISELGIIVESSRIILHGILWNSKIISPQDIIKN